MPSLTPLMRPRLALLASLLITGLLGACAIEWTNPQPARELAQRTRPPGSVYTGWRVFQDRCAGCHGADATGGASGAPDLTAKVRHMSQRRFVALVLTRYDWADAAAKDAPPGGDREALIDEVMARKQGALTMPAWQNEPRVNAHIVDLYAYLSARAEGTQGTGRPGW